MYYRPYSILLLLLYYMWFITIRLFEPYITYQYTNVCQAQCPTILSKHIHYTRVVYFQRASYNRSFVTINYIINLFYCPSTIYHMYDVSLKLSLGVKKLYAERFVIIHFCHTSNVWSNNPKKCVIYLWHFLMKYKISIVQFYTYFSHKIMPILTFEYDYVLGNF